MSIHRRWLPLALVAMAAGLVLVGVAAGAAYIYLSGGGKLPFPNWAGSKKANLSLTAWVNPLDQVRKEAIQPSSALLSLARGDALESAKLAISMGHLESAYAALVFSSEIPAEQRGGSLLLLAEAYAEEGESDKAGICYWQAGTVATLSPDLSDLVRADMFIRAARGLYGLGWEAEGQRYLGQARVVANYSPDLPQPVRAEVLRRVAEVYQEWEQEEIAEQVREEMARAPGILKPSSPGAKLPLPSAEAGTPPDRVLEAESRRKAAAQSLADHLLANPAGEGSGELVQALAAALREEDAARSAAYAERLQQAIRLSDRAQLMELWIRWLDIKHRVAAGGYGLSLLPEWEASLAEIKAQMNRAYQETYALYGDQVVALPASEEIEPAWVAVLRREILLGRLGLYPSYPEAELATELEEHTQKLPQPPPETSWLWVKVETIEGAKDFSLIPAADYGK